MGRLKRRSILGQQIAEILGTGEPFGSIGERPAVTRSLLIGSMAILAMNPFPANAIGLGEIEIESRLGEPLRATVPMNVSAGETIPANCVTAKRRPTALRSPRKLQVVSPAASGPGTFAVQVSTAAPLHEPMYELSIVVECPDVSSYTHHYVLMIELPDTRVQTPIKNPGIVAIPPAVGTDNVSKTPVMKRAAPDPVPGPPPTRKPVATPARLLTSTREPIPAGTLYTVRNGDSLSTIAARIAGRPPGTIWNVSKRIFQNNEHAFIRNNSDLIKMGSVIQIPDATELASIARPNPAPAVAAPADAPPNRPETPRQPAIEPSAALTSPTPAKTVTPPALAATSTGVQQPSMSASPGAAEPARSTPPEFVPVAPIAPTREPDTVTQAAKSAAEVAPQTQPEQLPAGESVAAQAIDQPAEPSNVQPRSPAEVREISPWIAIGTGILLGLSLSLLLLRERLLNALGDLFRRGTTAARASIGQKNRNKRASTARQTQAEALLSEANEFLDTIAEDAFQTNAEYPDYTAVIPVGAPVEDTYIVEMGRAPSEPTVHDTEVIAESAEAPDVEVRKDDPDASGSDLTTDDDTGDGKHMSDDTMLAHLFDDGYAKAGDVIDPTRDSLAGSCDANVTPAGEDVIDPTADVPAPQWPISDDPSTDLPIYRRIESIDPTVDMPRHAEVIDPTAEMPIGAPDPSTAETVEMPKDLAEDTPDHSSQIPMGAFGMDEPARSESFSDELGNIDPEAMFETSDVVEGLDNSPTDPNLLAQVLAEVEEETVSRSLPDNETFSDTLSNALSLLDREYEDEFTASQVLEGTAIRESLDDRDNDNPDFEDSQEREIPGKSQAG
jgi:pilus assembly protein FimV